MSILPQRMNWILLLLFVAIIQSSSSLLKELRLPGFKPSHNNQYVCAARKLDEQASYFIRSFSPSDLNGAAHHILLYGCEIPGSMKDVWICDVGYLQAKEFSQNEKEQDLKGFETAPICGSDYSNIIFAEAMQSRDYHLPNDVSFKVGKGTRMKYLVIQVHYKDVSKFKKYPDLKDYSGIDIQYETHPTKFLGGVLLLESGVGQIPPNRYEGDLQTVDVICTPSDIPRQHAIVPFAFRAHAHSHGVLVGGFHVRTNPWTHQNTWTMIGRKSPKVEQTFYPVETDIVIQPSDDLFARCVYSNPTDETIRIGLSRHDEMCNFYIMYYSSDSSSEKFQRCFNTGEEKWIDHTFVPDWVQKASLFSLPEQEYV